MHHSNCAFAYVLVHLIPIALNFVLWHSKHLCAVVWYSDLSWMIYRFCHCDCRLHNSCRHFVNWNLSYRDLDRWLVSMRNWVDIILIQFLKLINIIIIWCSILTGCVFLGVRLGVLPEVPVVVESFIIFSNAPTTSRLSFPLWWCPLFDDAISK